MKGCRINISVYFAVIIACIVVLDRTGLAALALLCAALHEAGHFTALRILKSQIEEISFKTFGINIRLSQKTRLSYRKEIFVALSGCASNLLFFTVSFICFKLQIFGVHAMVFCVMNLLLCVFNLLPIGPLDGGRALESVLCGHMQYGKAKDTVDLVSVLFIVPLSFLGVYLLKATGYNFSLILAALYLAGSMILKGKLLDFG